MRSLLQNWPAFLWFLLEIILPSFWVHYISPIFLLIQIQLMRLLVGALVGKLSPSFRFVWYDLPTNGPTNDPTNNCINWIWMSKKIGLYSVKKVSNYWYPQKIHLWYWQIWFKHKPKARLIFLHLKNNLYVQVCFLFLLIGIVFPIQIQLVYLGTRTKYTCGTGQIWFFFPETWKFATIIFLNHLKNIL